MALLLKLIRRNETPIGSARKVGAKDILRVRWRSFCPILDRRERRTRGARYRCHLSVRLISAKVLSASTLARSIGLVSIAAPRNCRSAATASSLSASRAANMRCAPFRCPQSSCGFSNRGERSENDDFPRSDGGVFSPSRRDRLQKSDLNAGSRYVVKRSRLGYPSVHICFGICPSLAAYSLPLASSTISSRWANNARVEFATVWKVQGERSPRKGEGEQARRAEVAKRLEDGEKRALAAPGISPSRAQWRPSS